MSWFRVVAGGGVPLLVCLATWRVWAIKTGEWRKSLALATVTVGVLIGAGTEILSLVHAVNAVGYLVLFAGHAASLVLVRRRLLRAGHRQPAVPWRLLRRPWVAAMVLVVGLLAGVAALSPPNNFDSMTYHMARVAHWASHGDVSHYATHIDRQLFLQPWAEYAILPTYVLSGTDYWANHVQWAAMAVTVVMASLLARNVGLGRRAQLVAAVIVLTLPMGITQSATTQNDYVATMWVAVLAAVVTGEELLARQSHDAVLIGTVAGLAAMTKATTYFFVAPLLLWWLLRRVDLEPLALGKAAALVAVPALVLTAPGFLRNLETFSRPLGPPLSEFVNDPVGPRALAENLVRHGALQLGVPSDTVNRQVTDGVRTVAGGVGLDVDNEGSTFPPGSRFLITFGYREDDAQATAAGLLLVVSVPLLLWLRRAGRRPLRRSALLPLLGCATAGVLLLESYFRWNPWNARYLMPFFVLTAVVSAAALARLPRWSSSVVMAALLGSSLLWVLGSDLRPVVGSGSVLTTPREDQYFAARPELRVPYQDAGSYLRALGPSTVGYVGSLDDWEYPLWVLLDQDDDGISLESVDVTNASKKYETASPDVVICTTACARPTTTQWDLTEFGSVSVWERS